MKRLVTGAVAALLTFATGSVTGISPPNYQLKASPRGNSPAPAARAVAVRRAREQSRFHWADAGGPALPLSPLSPATRGEAASRSALRSASGPLGFTAAAADAADLRELHDLGHGPVIARYQQQHNGLDVFGAQVSVVMDRDYRPVAYSGGFVKTGPVATGAVMFSAAAPGFALGTGAATRAALRDLARSSRTPGLNLLQAPAKIDRMYYAGAGGMIPAYRLTIRAAQADGAHQLGYGYLVSAVDGTILVRKNLMADAAFTYRAYADATTPFRPFDGPLGNGRIPFPGANPGDDPPRVPATANAVALQNGPISTNDAWLGATAALTAGNNARGYPDINNPDGVGGDAYVPTSSATTFDYASTADLDPSTTAARRAGVVNMFFMVNWMHDFWYDHGFDEAAGNAQLNNFARGGLGNDPILAEAQDFSGRNNANMLTPGDGESPIMQLYLFDGGEASLDVTSPALGTFQVGTAEFGPQSFDLSGDIAVPANDGCDPLTGVTGKIALVDRGNCNFTVKVKNAQNANAIGVLTANNVPLDGVVGMAGTDPTITIPALSISLEDGDQLKTAFGSGTVSVTMHRTAGVDRDAALDNAIIAHEFFHHVSNRLVNDGFGLINQQGNGMSEGWSDFNAMMLMVRPEDQTGGNATWAGTYSLGVYVAGAYFGGRRAPYSTDMDVNPLTFQHIQDGVALPNTAPLQFGGSGASNSEVHATGEIWANMLWEAYAALLNDSRYTFAQAQARMQDYVIAGLKVLPQSPTFVEARDGILAAARATDTDDFELIAAAFARRGIGAGAIAPDRDSIDQVGVTESYVALAPQFGIEDLDIDFHYDNGSVGYCDTDRALDPGETVLLSFTVVSNGTQDLPAGATIQIGSDGDTTLPDGGLVTLPALAVGATYPVNLLLKLNSAGGTAELLTLTFDFPDAGGSPDAVFEPATFALELSVNLDLGPTRSFDDVELAEASETDWSVALTNPASGPPWVTTDEHDATFGTGRVWYGHDNGTTATSTLATPVFHVTSSFNMTFDHYFEFEEPFDTGAGFIYFDGGVVEIAIDGGAFQDVTAAGGSFSPAGYNGASTAFGANPRQAFVDTNGSLVATTLSFGNALAGHDAQVRFRIASDEAVGAFGWVIDNVALNGISAPVFSTAVAENGVCVNHPPIISAGPNQTVNEGAIVTLAGTAIDTDADTLDISWARISGPNITLNGGTTLAPTFTAPGVSQGAQLTLRLTVDDGTDAVTDDVLVTVVNVSGGGGGGGGGGALGGELGLLGLLALLRRRRRRSA